MSFRSSCRKSAGAKRNEETGMMIDALVVPLVPYTPKDKPAEEKSPESPEPTNGRRRKKGDSEPAPEANAQPEPTDAAPSPEPPPPTDQDAKPDAPVLPRNQP
jgi:hypothetical protein